MEPKQLRLLFLDIDGVLNCLGDRHPNGYNGIGELQVARLNWMLERLPDLQLVIHSSWRYMILSGEMTLKGFETLLLTHGVDAKDRLHGYTAKDGYAKNGVHPNMGRAELIARYVEAVKPAYWAAVDDQELPLYNFVETNGRVGLTKEDVDKLLEMLTDEWEGSNG